MSSKQSNKKDLTDFQFGFSVAIQPIDDPSGKPFWLCKCQCGKEHKKLVSQILYYAKKAKDNPEAKLLGACSTICGRELNKRREIARDIEQLRQLAISLEEKWGEKIFIGTKSQAEENGYKLYVTGEECPNGHRDARNVQYRRCLQCNRDDYVRRIDIIKERARLHYINNIEHHKELMKKYHQENKDLIQQKVKQWVKENPEKVRESARKRRATPEGKLMAGIRGGLNRMFQRINTVKDQTTLKYVNCTVEEIKIFFEAQFTEGMSWDNYGEWHQDHVRPINSFNVMNKKERMVCFNWRNLQPLWANENLNKSDNYTKEDELRWIKRMRSLEYEGDLFLLFEEP